MRLRTSSARECTVLALDGALAIGDVPELRRQLGQASAELHDCVVCDLSRLGSADPEAMSVFATNQLDIVETGGPGPVICLAGARGAVADVIDRLRLRQSLPVAASVAEAATLARRRPPRLCATQTLGTGDLGARYARRFVQKMCDTWGLDEVADEAELVVSELASNVIRHAHTALVVRLERTRDRLFVSVKDETETAGSWWTRRRPAVRRGLAESGHGLGIVRALSASSGSYRHPGGGTVVWASFRIPPPEPVDSLTPMRPVHARITVNVGPSAGRGEAPRWAVRLEFGWRPEAPDDVTVSLSSQPEHPSLPYGEWVLPRWVLAQGLRRRVRQGAWRAWPERRGHQLVLEVPAEPVRTLRLPAWRIRRFLDATASPT